MHDYLNVMERTGHTTPFAMVTSFDKVAVARFNGNENEYDHVEKASNASFSVDKG